LWLKQIICELLAKTQIGNSAGAGLPGACTRQPHSVMTLSWDVLSTVTPSEYTRFRHVRAKLGSSIRPVRTVEYLRGQSSVPEISRGPVKRMP
jgi:tryptophan 2,3-dioxygenase